MKLLSFSVQIVFSQTKCDFRDIEFCSKSNLTLHWCKVIWSYLLSITNGAYTFLYLFGWLWPNYPVCTNHSSSIILHCMVISPRCTEHILMAEGRQIPPYMSSSKQCSALSPIFTSFVWHTWGLNLEPPIHKTNTLSNAFGYHRELTCMSKLLAGNTTKVEGFYW